MWHNKRGDIARALLYLDVRYDGSPHSITGHSEPDLVLTDNVALIVTSPDNQPVAHMGLLTDLLGWHVEDPVDDDERLRNDVVFAFQGNRNPFVDTPWWAGCVFLGACEVVFVDGFESGDLTAWDEQVNE